MYLDNILIYSDTYTDYVRYLRAVLERLRKFALFSNQKKYFFFTEEVEYLGYIVSRVGVSIDRSRVLTVED